MKKRKKALLCLLILTHAVFWGSLASSLLGMPIYPDRRGNFILLIALGATAAILSTAFILTRKHLKGDDMIGEGIHIASTAKSRLVNGVNYIASAVKSKAGYGSTETEQSLQKKKEPLIKGLCKVDGKEGTSLGEALGKLKLEWLLIYLDHSLIQVEQGMKPKDRHEQYFKDQVNQAFIRLSLTHHPDKSSSNDDAQRVINDVWQAMRKIHAYAMHIKDKGGSVYRERGYVYRLFSYVPISMINGSQDISQVINMAGYRKLHDLEYWEGALLIPARNNYLGEMKRVIIRALQIDLESIRTMFDGGSMDQKKIKIIHDMVNKSKEEFNECCNKYKEEYKKHWPDRLKLLNEECQKSKELEMIRSEVEELLKESEQQYRLLGGDKPNKIKPDEVFIQPILKYNNLANIYYKFILKLCEDIKSCFYKWGPLGSGFDSCTLDKQKFIVGNNETEFTQKSKEYVSGLSHQNLSELLNLMINYYYHKQNEKELREEIDKDYREEIKRKEIGNVLIFVLDRLAELYQEEFKQEETWFEQEKKRQEEAERKAEEINEALDRAEEGKARAEEGKARAELKDRARKALMRQIRKFDDELGDVVEGSQDQIVDSVVNYAMEHRQHPPEPIVSTVMEEIKLNREQVIREGVVNVRLINAGIEKFVKSENNTVSNSQNLNHGAVCTESNGRQPATNLSGVEIGSEIFNCQHSSI